MADGQAALERIDQLFAAARIAHEVIWDLHRRLVVAGRADEDARELLADVTRIATVDMPAAAAEVRRLAALWSEQDVLDPAGAVVTGRALAAEAQCAEALLADMRARQNEVAAEFRRRLADAGG
ncbi:MAG TPA: hypothetical protein VG474_17285 [Solirubrobacteraceae bacterium]|nr:hypothetical protein [Solirubrobacteraceae bacterium]